MNTCPTCGTSVPAGQTICEECGAELVDLEPSSSPEPDRSIGEAGELEATVPPDVEPGASAQQPEVSSGSDGGVVGSAIEVCPECDEKITPDANGWCPLCGAILEDPWGDDPPEAALDDDPDALGPPPWTLKGDAGAAGTKRSARRRHDVLLVEVGGALMFDGRPARSIILNVDEISVGRLDPDAGHIPDLDLSLFRETDPHISRRHARLFREEDTWYIEDLCSNDATWLNDAREVLNDERRPLEHDDRIGISDSVVLRYVVRPSEP